MTVVDASVAAKWFLPGEPLASEARAVLYEILTGAPPHSGKTTREILESVISLPPKPVLEAAPDAPPELAVICEKARCKDPAGRYQSAVELAEEVQRFVDGIIQKAVQKAARMREAQRTLG